MSNNFPEKQGKSRNNSVLLLLILVFVRTPAKTRMNGKFRLSKLVTKKKSRCHSKRVRLKRTKG